MNALEKLIDKALLLLRDWAYENPYDYEPGEVIEEIAESCVPASDAAVIEVAKSAELELPTKTNADRTDESGTPVDLLKVTLFDLIQGRLLEEWDIIEGERELMNEMEDDLP